jgi:hypothetical protein
VPKDTSDVWRVRYNLCNIDSLHEVLVFHNAAHSSFNAALGDTFGYGRQSTRREFMQARGLAQWVGERSRPTTFWLSCASLVAIMASDYFTGVEVNFTLFYLVPVFFVTWSIDRRSGIFASLWCALGWGFVDYLGRPEFRVGPALWNAWIQFGLFVTFSFVLTWIKSALLEQNKLNTELQAALAEVQSLSGLLPMCAWCRKIREEDGEWVSLETYVADHSGADFTHGICPTCKAARERKA